jgi:hypothetical protein
VVSKTQAGSINTCGTFVCECFFSFGTSCVSPLFFFFDGRRHFGFCSCNFSIDVFLPFFALFEIYQ